MKKILFVPESQNVCFWHRCLTPAKLLQHMGYEVKFHQNPPYDLITQQDVVVFQRSYLPDIYDMISLARKHKIFTVYDIDDDLWNIPKENADYNYYHQPKLLYTVKRAIGKVDLVTTTTETMAKILRPMNSKVMILPNMLSNDNWLLMHEIDIEKDNVVIGWAGTNTHWGDLNLLKKVIPFILDKYPNVYFKYAGMSGLPFEHTKIEKLPSINADKYDELLANFDIGIAPLVDATFNESKSDLKYLEYSAMGIPTVASNVVSYQSIVPGETGFLASNDEEWIAYLSVLIEDKISRKNIGENAKNYVRNNRMIYDNIKLWLDAYKLTD